MSLSVSIVINTLNRCHLLRQTLLSLNNLSHNHFEVIVVNGPSTDETGEMLIALGDKIKIVSCPSANLSQSRNIGIQHASGDIIAFIDDDAVPHPQWLNKLDTSKYLASSTRL